MRRHLEQGGTLLATFVAVALLAPSLVARPALAGPRDMEVRGHDGELPADNPAVPGPSSVAENDAEDLEDERAIRIAAPGQPVVTPICPPSVFASSREDARRGRRHLARATDGARAPPLAR